MRKTVTSAVAWLLILAMLGMNFAALAEELTLPADLQIISEEAFCGDTSIEKVIVPEGATEIESRAFADSSLTEIELPSTLTSIADDAFENVEALSVTAPEDSYAYEWAEGKGYIAPPTVETAPEEDFTYTINSDNTATVTGYVGDGGDVVMPATLGGVPVVEIGSYAFYECSTLTSITIPETLKTISNYAFAYCRSLIAINSLDSISSVGHYAFYACTGVDRIHISSLESWLGISFGNRYSNPLFYSDNLYVAGTLLTDAIIPKNVSSIGDYVFYNYSPLTSIRFLDGSISIGNDAFYNCQNLKDIYIPSLEDWLSINFSNTYSTPLFYANNLYIDGNLLSDMIIPDSITSIGDYSFYSYDNLTSVSFTNNIMTVGSYAFYGCNGLTSLCITGNITSLGDYAFASCDNLDNVSILDGVTAIGNYSFFDCSSLTTIDLPDSITSIGVCAFEDCYNLTSINIPDSLVSIGDHAFRSCSLINISVPGSVTSIGNYAFSDCRYLTSITLGDGITSIGDYAFSSCSSLIDIVLPDSITSIGDYAFSSCSGLTTIALSNNVMVIGDYAFSSCSNLTTISLPNSVTSIGNYAFNSCSSLTDIVLPDSLASIGVYAFSYCSSLTSVTLSDSVTSIGEYAFNSCKNLTSLVLSDGHYTIGNNAFNYCSNLTEIHVPTLESWLNINFCGISSTPLYYARNLYIDGALLTEAIIPDSITTIGSYAFMYYKNLTTVVLPNGVTSIGDYAFFSCRYLTSISIPDSVISIGDSAFCQCNELINVNIPNGITSISDDMFHGCYELTSITIPDSVTSIGSDAFAFTKLYDIDIPDGVTSIGSYAFDYCEDLITIVLPNSVTSIGEYAFRNCSSLTSITIPSSVTSIGDNVFSGCTSLTIYGISGSYAETYAAENSIAFSTDNMPGTGIEFGSNDLRTVGSAAATLTYQINSDSDWTATYIPDWITLSAESGVSGDTITISVEANTGLNRTDYVRFESDTQYSDLFITQSGDAGASLADPVITYPATDNDVVELVDVHVIWEPVEGADSYIFSLRDLTTDTLQVYHMNTGTDAEATEITLPYSYFAAGHTYRVAIGAVAEGRAAYETTTSWAERIFAVECTIDDNRAALGGQVVSSAGNPVEGATVSMYVTAGDYEDVKVAEAVTDADGCWTCGGLRRGVTYYCSADSDSYFFADEYVTVTASDTENSVGTITALNTLDNEVYVFNASPSLWECSEETESVETYLTADGSWTASADADWITLSATSGDASSAIGIEVGENIAEEERVGVITFTASNGDTAKVTIQQEAAEALMVSAASTTTIKELTSFSAGENITYDGDLILKNTLILHGATITVKGNMIVKAKGRLDLSDGGTVIVNGDFTFDSNKSHIDKLTKGTIKVGGNVEIKRNFYASEKNAFHVFGSNTHEINMWNKWFADQQYFNNFYIDDYGIEVLKVKEAFRCSAGFVPANWNVVTQKGALTFTLTRGYTYNWDREVPDYVLKNVQIGLARALAEYCSTGKKDSLLDIRYIKGQKENIIYCYLNEDNGISSYGIDINMFGAECKDAKGNISFGKVIYHDLNTGKSYDFLVASSPEQIYNAFLAFRDVVKDFVISLAIDGYDAMCEDMAKSIILDRLPPVLSDAYSVTSQLCEYRDDLKKLYELVN